MLKIQKKVFTSFEEAGINIPAWNSNDKVMMRCPQCSDDRKNHNKSKKVLSVAISAKLFNCHHCGFSGKIIDPKNVVQYFKPEPIEKRADDDLISDAAKLYLMNRGIDIQSALQFGIISTIKSFRSQKNDGFENKESIVFPYNSAKGELLFYKYRSLEKEFSGSKAPQYVFWQLDKFKDKKILVITEGEYDALSWQTAFNRLPNGWSSKGENININDIAITSVPNGISTKQLQNESVIIEYFERCIPFVQHFEQIYISTDNDEAGLMLQGELARRFGKDICKIIKFPNQSDQKDANGVLMAQGEKKLQELFNSSDTLPIEGIYTANDIRESLRIELGTEIEKGHSIGFEVFDEYLTFDIKEGLTLITGAPNSAKSDFMFNIMIRLSLRNNWKWLLCSPESGDVKSVYTQLLEKLIGYKVHKNKFNNKIMSSEDFEWGMDFLESHIYTMESTDYNEYTLETYVDKTKKAVKKYGINAAVIDPFNAFDNAFGDGNMSNQLNKDLTLLQLTKRKLGINVFVVAHPKAMISTQMTSIYDVNGGAAWANKVDNFIILNRGEAKQFTDGRGDDIECKIMKVKKRHLGKRGELLFAYHIPTGRFGEQGVIYDDNIFKNYNDILGMIEKQKEDDRDPFLDPLPQTMPKVNFATLSEEEAESYF